MKNKYRKIGIYGISCAGKSSVSKRIEELNPYQYKFIDGSSVFNEICEDGLSGFKSLPFDKKHECRKLAIKYLKQLQEKEKKHFVIAGHYSFLHDDNYEIAWTDSDEKFYTDIFILDEDIDIIYERCKKQGKIYSKNDLKRWSAFEKSKLLNLQKKVYEIKSKTIIDRAFETIEEINKRLILDELQETIYNSCDIFLLFDADGTIISNDSSEVMQKYLNNSSPDKIKQLFKQYPYYEFKAFWEVANHYSLNNNIDTFDYAYKNASKEIKIREEFLFLLRLPNVNKILLSAGFKNLWKFVLKEHQIEDVKVISGNTLYDNYLVGDKEKGYVVDFLHENNKQVISFGDGLVDRYMLEKSDKAYLIVNEKKRSINKYIEDMKNLEYLSFSNIELEGIKKTSVDKIINLIKS